MADQGYTEWEYDRKRWFRWRRAYPSPWADSFPSWLEVERVPERSLRDVLDDLLRAVWRKIQRA
jgi:hypothetical protein